MAARPVGSLLYGEDAGFSVDGVDEDAVLLPAAWASVDVELLFCSLGAGVETGAGCCADVEGPDVPLTLTLGVGVELCAWPMP